MLKRWIKRLLKLAVLLLLLLFAFLVFERVRGQISLARYQQQLIAHGEKLSPNDFVQRFSDSDNGAPVAIAAIERLRDGAALPNNYAPVMKVMPSGRAVVGFREDKWTDGEVTNDWEQVATDLNANQAILTEILAALEKPVLNNNVDLSEGVNLKFTHIAAPKKLTRWLGSGCQLALRQQKSHEALKYLLAEIRLPRIFREDRLLISELVRLAIVAIGKAETWEAMQADGWADGDLATLQKAWESQEFAGEMARSLEGERVFSDVSAEMIRQSNQKAADMMFGLEDFFGSDESGDSWWRRLLRRFGLDDTVGDFVRKQVYCRIWRFAWSHQDQRHGMEYMQRLIEIARKVDSQKSYAAVLPDVDRFRNHVENRNLYDKWRYPLSRFSLSIFGSVPDKAVWAETERSLCIAAIALKRYSLRHGKFPPSLDALVPALVAAVPGDYFDGKPIKYRLNNDGTFTLYSVGENLTDDGGDVTPTKEGSRALRNRRDYVWPVPALPDEVEAYRREAAED